MSKICAKCKESKNEAEFFKQATAADGKGSYCKACHKIARGEFIARNKERNSKRSAEEIRVNTPLFKCYKCKQIKPSSVFAIDKTKSNGLSTFCSECGSVFRNSFYERNENYQKEYNTQYYIKNAEKAKAITKKYTLENKDEIRKKMRIYESKRLKVDMGYRLRRYLRDNIRKALAKGSLTKDCRTLVLLGCSIQEFRQRLESQFQPGMSWENYGEWQIDHIKPCAAFDFSDLKQQEECFHYTNMQPLWREENGAKNSYFEGKKYYYKNTDK